MDIYAIIAHQESAQGDLTFKGTAIGSIGEPTALTKTLYSPIFRSENVIILVPSGITIHPPIVSVGDSASLYM